MSKRATRHVLAMYSSKYGMVTVTCLASPVLPRNSQTSGRRTKEAKKRLEANGNRTRNQRFWRKVVNELLCAKRERKDFLGLERWGVFRFCFLVNFCVKYPKWRSSIGSCRRNGYHPQGDLAKSGYEPDMKSLSGYWTPPKSLHFWILNFPFCQNFTNIYRLVGPGKKNLVQFCKVPKVVIIHKKI